MEGIDHLVNGNDSVILSGLVNLKLFFAPKLCDKRIAEAHFLCRFKSLKATLIFANGFLHLDYFLKGLKEAISKF